MLSKYTIKFDYCPHYLPMRDDSDKSVKAARKYAERIIGKELPAFEADGFPHFIIYVTEEIGGN